MLRPERLRRRGLALRQHIARRLNLKEHGFRRSRKGKKGVKCEGRVAQIDLRWKEKRTQAGGDVLTECSHHDGRTKERAAALQLRGEPGQAGESQSSAATVKELIDFGFAREEVAHCYGSKGNVSVDPEVILKMMFLLFFDDVASERELMKIIAERLDYLWFFGLRAGGGDS